MYEVELKVRADHDELRERLDAIGAVQSEKLHQTDTYYDAPHRDFASTDEALRIRRERKASEESADARVTYKGPLLDDQSKSREEFETGVEDGETIDEVFQRLGFSPAATVRKDRTEFTYEEYTITLDSVEGLGEFVEVETETESSDIDAARDGARELLGRLGLDPDEQIRTSYLGLLLAED